MISPVGITLGIVEVIVYWISMVINKNKIFIFDGGFIDLIFNFKLLLKIFKDNLNKII